MSSDVLHIVESLDRGAVERGLVKLMRAAKNTGKRLRWSFFCVSAKPGELDEEVFALGGDIIRAAYPLSDILRFGRQLRRVVASRRFDVVHMHHDVQSAVYLLAIAGLPVRKRIVHVHNVAEVVPVAGKLKAQLIRPVLKAICLIGADRTVAVSEQALAHFTRHGLWIKKRGQVLYNAVDANEFRHAWQERDILRVGLRRALDLRPSTLVLLFVGRLVPEKRPILVVEILSRLHAQDVVAVFVGDGPLSEEIQERAEGLGLGARIFMMGWKDDVAELMASCDVLVFPSLNEGFGLAMIEAQLVGLSIIATSTLPADAQLQGSLVVRVPPQSSADGWVEALRAALNAPQKPAPRLLVPPHMDTDFVLAMMNRLHGD